VKQRHKQMEISICAVYRLLFVLLHGQWLTLPHSFYMALDSLTTHNQ
jgi:hypothetical protein